MKVILLDIDGVLQPYASKNRFEIDRKALRERLSEELNIDYTIYDEYDVAACYADWDKEAVERIKKIIKETDAKIVISSDWRSKRLPNKMKDFLKIFNMDQYWVGETDDIDEEKMKEACKYVKSRENPHWSYRAIEILDYVYKHEEITNYVAIDDMDISVGLDGHFVKTKNLINDEQAEKCIQILNDTKLEIKRNPYNKEILEKCLPSYIENDLKNLKDGIKNNVSYLDCLINELQGSVNSAFVNGDISEEQCDYLYEKYIIMEI